MAKQSASKKTVAENKSAPLTRREYSADLLTEIQAAEILAVEPRTLRLWRATRGLPYLRITPQVIRYRRSDLDAWLARHLVAVAA